MAKAAEHAIATRQTGNQYRAGTFDIPKKSTEQNRNGDHNCISIGQRVPGIHRSELASSAIVGPAMQVATRSAKPSDVSVGLSDWPGRTQRNMANIEVASSAKMTNIRRLSAAVNQVQKK